MASYRIPRRRELLNTQSTIFLQDGTALNQFEEVIPLHPTRHSDANLSHYLNLSNRYHSPAKSTKKKFFSVNSSERLSSRSFPVIIQTHPGSIPSQIQSSIENDLNRVNQDEQNIEFAYPQNIFIGPKTLNKPCSCSITMKYRADPTFSSISSNSRRDEVTVFQYTNDGSNWIVFKGFLQMGDSFTFKSQRSEEDRFHLKLEINGSLDTTILGCCEYFYHRGGRIDDGDSSFWIETIEQYTSCTKCRETKELSQEESDEEAEKPLPSDESEQQDNQTVDKGVHQETTSAPPTQPLPASNVDKTTDEKSLKTADDQSSLFEYINNVMQQALSETKPNETIPPRSIGDVENFSLLYIDENEKNDLNLLRPLVNFIRIIKDPNTLRTSLATWTNEKIIVVISSNETEAFVSELQPHKCIQAIYILTEQTSQPQWIHQYDKVIGFYSDLPAIRDDLTKTIPDLLTTQIIPMEITSKNTTSDLSFTYCQLLKETMLCQDEESDLKKDMLAFCRLHYDHNQEELEQIEQFEKTFTEPECIQWYTRYCFLTKILTRAFRTQEIDLLFKMRYFIQCLDKQIQSISNKEPITTYASFDLDQETIRKLQENTNGLVIFHSFLPTTLVENPRTVLFSIRLGPNTAANIEQLRSATYKFDVLININTIFRLVSVDSNANGVRTVHLESVSHDDSHFQQLTGSLRNKTQASVVILQLTKLLLETNHYWTADYLTELVYQDQSFEGDATLLASLAAAHHLLGNSVEGKKDFKTARYHFFKSLRAFLKCLSNDHALLSSTYNNIGSMYYQEDHHEHAIKFHQMALQCQLKASTPDMDAVATYSANIGAVYIDQKKYMEATVHFKRAILIQEKMSKKDNPKRLITLYQKLSSCYWHTKKFEEALEYYNKTLDLQLKFTNPLPYPLSVTYYNLSTAYGQLGDYDKAVACAEKSIEYLKMDQKDHPELKENQAQLEIVRQKQWLKQVLST